MSTPVFISVVRSHVRLRETAPVTAALTGRAHQRFEGQRRLVCGAVAFRVDAGWADEADPAAAHTAAASSSSSSTGGDGGLVVRSAPTLQVLLVQSKKKNEWIFPKGGWEQFESARECAARESLEESGVSGVMLAALAPVEFASKKRKQSRLYPFLMQVTDMWMEWAEAKSRERRWFDWTEVAGVMQRQETKAVWADAVRKLTQLGYIDAQGHAVFQQPPSTPPHIDEPVVPASSTAAGASAVAPPSAAAAASSSSSSAAPASSSTLSSNDVTFLHALRFPVSLYSTRSNLPHLGAALQRLAPECVIGVGIRDAKEGQPSSAGRWIVLLTAGTTAAAAHSCVLARLAGLVSSSNPLSEWARFVAFQRQRFEPDVQPFVELSPALATQAAATSSQPASTPAPIVSPATREADRALRSEDLRFVHGAEAAAVLARLDDALTRNPASRTLRIQRDIAALQAMPDSRQCKAALTLDERAFASVRQELSEDPQESFECMVCCDRQYYCRGCTGGLSRLSHVLHISWLERERIYKHVFGGCGEPHVPCIVCNRRGHRVPDGSSILRDFWTGFRINFGPLTDDDEEDDEDEEEANENEEEEQ